MYYDTNINLPLRLDVLLRLTVYSELTSYVPLNSGLAGRKTFVIFSVSARACIFSEPSSPDKIDRLTSIHVRSLMNVKNCK